MTSSSEMMNKFLVSNEVAIEELQEEIVELQLQLNASVLLDDKLHASLTDMESRASEKRQKHEELFNARNEVLDGINKLLAQSLERNDHLATQYVKILIGSLEGKGCIS